MAFMLSLPTVAELLTIRTAAYCAVLWIIQLLCRAIYNVSSFHPLHKIPGPKLAAASYLYEFYFDFVQWGRYTHEIKRLHEIYGPIVRINPNEIHCNDPNFVEEIYPVGGRKRNKSTWHLRHTTTTCASDENLLKSPDIQTRAHHHDLAQQLCNKLLAQGDIGHPFDLTGAYSCFTSDVISSYCFGESFGFLDQTTFEPNFRSAIYSMLKTRLYFRYFPRLKSIVALEPYLRNYMPKDLTLFSNTLNANIPNMIKKSKTEHEAGIVKNQTTVFDALLDSELPVEEKTVHRLAGEAVALLTAGTETTSWTLTIMTFHIINSPYILARLTQELENAVPDPRKLPPWFTLEKLPYLGAVILEDLRLSYGVAARTARVATEEDIHYHGTWVSPSSNTPVNVDYIIPRWTAMSTSNYIMHHNESVFPNSNKFLPNRWLDEKGQRSKEFEPFLMSFNRGSRQCLGINLAYCELYLALTTLILRVFPRMKLHQTTMKDVKYDHDLGVPMVEKSSKGVWVVME